jgi:hypothetical protein
LNVFGFEQISEFKQISTLTGKKEKKKKCLAKLGQSNLKSLEASTRKGCLKRQIGASFSLSPQLDRAQRRSPMRTPDL